MGWLLFVAMALFLATPASAHHIFGLPHYEGDGTPSQGPVFTCRVDAGPYELKLVGYPGKPKPGEHCLIHASLQHRQSGRLFSDKVKFTVLRTGPFREPRIVYGPVEAGLQQDEFEFLPQFNEEGEYLLRVEFEAEGVPWSIDSPMVVGEAGPPWVAVALFGTGLVLFVTVIGILRARRQRATIQESVVNSVTA